MMLRLYLILLVIWVSGCSPVARIAQNTNDIRAEARALSNHGTEIQDSVVIDRSARIDALAADIHQTLPAVQDKTPAWLATLYWWGIAVACLAVLFILWQSGAFMAIRVALGWIPRKKMQDADLALTMLDPDKPENPREYIAARRAADPVFDAAFRKASGKR